MHNSNNSKINHKLIELRDERDVSYKHILHELKYACKNVYYLRQSDFTNGSYIITEPGKYVLKEDILFAPNPDNKFRYYPDTIYSKMPGFILGFFAAIVVNSDNVIIDGAGHEIVADEKFSLCQRFYSHIELNPAPFVMGQGPADFGKYVPYPKNIMIKNVRFGRTPYHCVHGKGNVNTILRDLYAKDYEFVAYALNLDDTLHYINCIADHNLQHLEVNALWSAALFLELWTERLLSKYPQLQVPYDKLQDLITRTKNDLFNHAKLIDSEAVRLFKNKPLYEGGPQLPDGNCYGFLNHPTGFAVHDFDDNIDHENRCKRVFMFNCEVKNIRCNVDEVIGLSLADGTGGQVDVAGSGFKIELVTNLDGTYKSNPVADMQIALANLQFADVNPTNVSKNSITKDVIDWAMTPGAKLQDYVLNKEKYKYVCAQDSMFHINKGLLGIRMEAVDRVLIEQCKISGLENQARLGSTKHCGNYTIGCSLQNKPGYRGCSTVGIHVACASDFLIHNFTIDKLWSHNGQTDGIKLINDAIIMLSNGKITELRAGHKYENGRWVGIDHDYNQVTYNCNLPNFCPIATGVNVKDKHCKCYSEDVCIKIGNNAPVSVKTNSVSYP